MDPNLSKVESRLAKIEGELAHIRVVLWILVVLMLLLLTAAAPGALQEIVFYIGLAGLLIAVIAGCLYLLIYLLGWLVDGKANLAELEAALRAEAHNATVGGPSDPRAGESSPK